MNVYLWSNLFRFFFSFNKRFGLIPDNVLLYGDVIPFLKAAYNWRKKGGK